MLSLPLLAGSDKFVAAQYPELGRQIVTNQNVLQPVRPMLAQPEFGIFKTAVVISIPHVFTQAVGAGEVVKQAGDALRVLRILLPPEGLLVEARNFIGGFKFLADEIQPSSIAEEPSPVVNCLTVCAP